MYSQVDHSDVSHLAAFVRVLYAFRMILSSASIISWFDSLLRRALREPRLDVEAVKQAKELVLMPLYDESESKAQLLRRRLVQLYVLDAPKENDSAVETMAQNADERAKMAVWKSNLEDLLVSDGVTRPKELFEELDSELADLDRWKDKDVATVAAECTLLDIQNAQTSAGHSIAYHVPPTPQASGHPTPQASGHPTPQASGNTSLHPPGSTTPARIPLPPSPAGSAQPIHTSRRSSDDSEKSLEIMVHTHAALTAPPEPLLILDETSVPRPRHAMAEEALSILQRDVLILKNQLNFEVYLKELVQQHVGRLHQDRIVSRSEEAERQGLHTKLKDYKAKLTKAQEDLATIRAEAAGTKSRHTQEEKRSWAAEAVELRGEVNDTRAALKAQNEALADALNEVFNLKQQLRESAPKVEKIAAYEQTIDQLVKAQALRDDSPEMRSYREDRAKLDEMISNYAKMELSLESLQHANEQLTALHKTQEDELGLARSHITDLTRRLASATTQNPFSRSATKA
ncbi:hypothetical protein RSAG8_13349, partial [Rhizoctonia solani AG-8 WAC10335]